MSLVWQSVLMDNVRYRRIFVFFFEKNTFEAIDVSIKEKDAAKYKKLVEYQSWLVKQFHSYSEALQGIISSEDDAFRAAAILTLQEVSQR